MKKPTGLLVFSHDLSYAFTKTTEAIAMASRNLGVPSVVRDSFDPRMLALLSLGFDEEKLALEVENHLAQQLEKLIHEFEFDCALALDLNWLFLPDFFIDHPKIRKLFSIWFDDYHSWCRTKTNAIFPYRKYSFQEILAHPKVLHSFYGEALAREAKLIGMHNQIRSKLAAPSEFLSLDYPCQVKDKLAFIGNPGYRGEPKPEVLKRIQEGADFPELRKMSRDELLAAASCGTWPWMGKHPSIIKLFSFAMSMKIENPFISSLEIIDLCRQGFPDAIEILNNAGEILSLCWAIKLVNRYDRPALVTRLYNKGLLDVISNTDEWKPYEVVSAPSIFTDQMPVYYMKYFAHVNASNPLRDATANEKLFEIAACGRVSLNIKSFDVCECYQEGEICVADSLEEAEEKARYLISHPDEALAMGEKARKRTAQEHTWEHRLTNLFEQI